MEPRLRTPGATAAGTPFTPFASAGGQDVLPRFASVFTRRAVPPPGSPPPAAHAAAAEAAAVPADAPGSATSDAPGDEQTGASRAADFHEGTSRGREDQPHLP